ncbi:MAG: TldD/PmbA family protein [Bacteroidetes bacterium]|nr:TldD/PmbA family protein [Bacteroidota bacterium]
MKIPDNRVSSLPQSGFWIPDSHFPGWLTGELPKLAVKAPSHFLFIQARTEKILRFENERASQVESQFSSGFACRAAENENRISSDLTRADFSSVLREIPGNRPDVIRKNLCWGPALSQDSAELHEIALRIRDWLRSRDSRVRTVAIECELSDSESAGINRAGVIYHKSERFSDWRITVVCESKKGQGSGSSRVGERDFSTGIPAKDPFSAADLALRKALISAASAWLIPGSYDLLLPPGWGNLFFHETAGHLFEADSLSAGRVSLVGKSGDLAGPACLSVLDDGTLPGRGGIDRDDEGTLLQKSVLIDRGRVSGCLADRKTARETGVSPTGNGRRYSWETPVLTRMTNTVILPGTESRPSLLAGMRAGIEVIDTGNGWVDGSTGAFRFEIGLGYKIVNGHRNHAVSEVLVTGMAPEILKKVVAVGNDFYLENSTGFCDKQGQRLPVSIGGPSVLLHQIQIGNYQL